jgi:hypothetical protein
MDLIYKLISWTLSFIVNFVVVTSVYTYQYLSTLFDMPTDIWKIINEDLEEDSK